MNPRLEDLLSEPIVQLLMNSDGVSPDAVRGLMRRVAAQRSAAPDRHAAHRA